MASAAALTLPNHHAGGPALNMNSELGAFALHRVPHTICILAAPNQAPSGLLADGWLANGTKRFVSMSNASIEPLSMS